MKRIISNQNVVPATETKQAFDLSLGTNFGYAGGAYTLRLEKEPAPTTDEKPETLQPTAKEIIQRLKHKFGQADTNTDTPVATDTTDTPTVPETTETRVVTFKTKGKPGRPKKAQVAAPSVSTITTEEGTATVGDGSAASPLPAPVNTSVPPAAPTTPATSIVLRTPVVSTVPVLTPTTHTELDGIVKRGKAADLDLAQPYKSLEELISRVNAVEASLNEFREFGHRRTYVQIAIFHEYLTNAIKTDEGLKELVLAANRRQIDLNYGESAFYFQITKLFWGAFNPDADKVEFAGLKNLTKWVPNRGAEKYAYVLKHLNSKGTKAADVADYIENFKSKGCRNKLFGIIDYERGLTRPTKPTARIVMNEDDAVLIATSEEVKPVATLPKPETITATAGLVILAARIINGELEIIGPLDFDETNAAVKGAVSGLARKLGIPVSDEKAIEELRKTLRKAA